MWILHHRADCWSCFFWAEVKSLTWTHFHMLLVWFEDTKQACPDLENIRLVFKLSYWLMGAAQPTWSRVTPPFLFYFFLSVNPNNSFTENTWNQSAGCSSLPTEGFLSTMRVIWHQYYTLPVIVCSILHFFFFFFFPPLVGSLQRAIIFSWEALVSQHPLTSLDTAPS